MNKTAYYNGHTATKFLVAIALPYGRSHIASRHRTREAAAASLRKLIRAGGARGYHVLEIEVA